MYRIDSKISGLVFAESSYRKSMFMLSEKGNNLEVMIKNAIRTIPVVMAFLYCKEILDDAKYEN